MSAEFRRNAWVELTVQRLVLPLVILCLVYVTTRGVTSTFGIGPGKKIFFGLFAVICLFWGGKLANDAVPEEIREHTWDTQRMSSVGAWTMTWGKLFGSTIYAWYLSALCLAFYFFGYPLDEIRAEDLKGVVSVAALAVVFQGTCFISSLESPRADTKRSRPGIGILFLLLAVTFGRGLFSGAASISSGDISWYDAKYSRENFLLVSTVVFAAWALLGAYRRMRAELLYRSTPAVWILFLGFLMFYINGFASEIYDRLTQSAMSPLTGSRAQLYLLISFLIAMGAAWLTLIAERKDLVRLRKAAQRVWQKEDRGRTLELLPTWAVSGALAVSLFGAMLAMASVYGPLERGGPYKSNLFAAALLLFFLRDAFIMLAAHLSRRFKNRANMAAMVYFFVLYFLMPWFLGATGRKGMLHWFVPLGGADISELAGIAVQVLLAGVLFAQRWSQVANRAEA